MTKRDLNLIGAITSIALIAVITLISATSVGLTSTEKLAESVKRSDIIHITEEGKPDYGPGPGQTIYTITFTNGVIPRQKQLPLVNACIYDSATRRGTYIGTRWNLASEPTGPLDLVQPDDRTVQLGYETKTVNLEIVPQTFWKPRPAATDEPMKPVPIQEETAWDTIYLFFNDERGLRDYYPQCENLQQAELARARTVKVVGTEA